MNILITGGTGLIGTRLVRKLTDERHHVWLTTRDSRRYTGSPLQKYIDWDGRGALSLPAEFDAVIHLMGASVVGKRWTPEYRKEILESRTVSSRALFQSFERAGYFPDRVISSSATGYYGSRGDELLDEESKPGTGFLTEVCIAWEDSMRAFERVSKHVAYLRTGIVLDPSGGAFPRLLLPFKLFAGGKLGSGQQWFSWIHHADLTNIITFCLHNEVSGPLNAVAPSPVRMSELAKIIGQATRRPDFFTVPEFMLRIALGEAAIEITKSQKVFPKKLQSSHFEFGFPDLGAALPDLLQNN